MTSNDTFVDFKIEWPKLYNKIKNTKWFNNIASYYTSMMIYTPAKGNYKTCPIIRIIDKENISSSEILYNATSPDKLEWWITPGDCFCVNGIFLFLIMVYSGIKVKIYTNSKHIFLRDEKDKILDLYYPQYSNCDDYKDAKEVLPLDLWYSYDILSSIIKDNKMTFIFKDKLINPTFTHQMDSVTKNILSGGEYLPSLPEE